MAEAIALGASIIAIIQISERVIDLCKFYLGSIHDAPSDLRSILIETSTTKAILENVEILVSSSNDKSSILEQLAGEDGPIHFCRGIMTKMEALFPSDYHQAQNNTSKRQKFKASMALLAWPLKADRAKKLVDELSKVKATINLALTVQSIQDVKAIHTQLSYDEHDKICRWLEITDPSPLHHQACSQYEPKTGDWILRSREWADWLRGTTRCLWINGIPGAGKSILVSHLINELNKNLAHTTDDHALVYYYCSFTHNQQEAAPFLRWTINMLCRQMGRVPKCLYDIYRRGGTPSIVELLDIFDVILRSFEKVYIVLDAVDESSMPRDELLHVLHTLASTPRFLKIRLLATSREYLDIEQSLKPISVSVSMRNPLLDEDIKVYVTSKLKSNPRFKHWPPDLVYEVLEVLSTKAKGMFRWVVCQIYTLERLKPKPNIVRDALANLPNTLDETYERIFEAIPDDYRLVVLSALKWIFYHEDLSSHSISLPLLIEAVDRTISSTTSIENCIFLDKHRLQEICGCLIIIIPRSSQHTRKFSTLSFAHYTVWEFVTSGRITQPRAALFSIEVDRTRIELTNIIICAVVNFKINHWWPDCHKNCCIARVGVRGLCTQCASFVLIGLDKYFEVFCTYSSLHSLKGSAPLRIHDQKMGFHLVDNSRNHFALLKLQRMYVAFSIVFNQNFPRLLQNNNWPPLKTPNVCAQRLAMLLVRDKTCALAQKFIEQTGEEHIFRDEVDAQLLWGTFSKRYAFTKIIFQVSGQLSSCPVRCEIVLPFQGSTTDPSRILLSFIRGARGEMSPEDFQIVVTFLKLDMYSYCVTEYDTSSRRLYYQIFPFDSAGGRILLDAGADLKYEDYTRWEAGTSMGQYNVLNGRISWDSRMEREGLDRIEAYLRGEELQLSDEDLDVDENDEAIDDNDGGSDIEQ